MNRRLAFALMLLGAGCSRSQAGSSAFLTLLDEALRTADRVVITEHSFHLDAFDPDVGTSLLPNTVIYKTVDLTAAQRGTFRSAMGRVDPRPQDALTACIFEPHHTIRFHEGDGVSSALQICFSCAQLKWDLTDAVPPRDIYPGLASALQPLGFEAERDWRRLALEHRANGASQPPASPP